MRLIISMFLILMVVSLAAPSFAVNQTISTDIKGLRLSVGSSPEVLVEELKKEKERDVIKKIKKEKVEEEVVEIPTWTWPTPDIYDVSYGFGDRWHPVYGGYDFHNGIDILGDWEADIVAAKDGEVVYAGWMSGYGLCVILQHEDNIQTLYGHGSLVLVNEGDYVYMGDKIMLMGSTGTSNAIHLHFGIRESGYWVNPFEYVDIKKDTN